MAAETSLEATWQSNIKHKGFFKGKICAMVNHVLYMTLMYYGEKPVSFHMPCCVVASEVMKDDDSF